jgi:hypothetical protein
MFQTSNPILKIQESRLDLECESRRLVSDDFGLTRTSARLSQSGQQTQHPKSEHRQGANGQPAEPPRVVA